MGPERFTEKLFEAAKEIWDAQLRHPFVRGIGAGTLDPPIFERWVRQDYLYLKEFARVFAFAAARADRLESMSWYAAALHLTLNTEMQLHREYAERFGITRADLEEEPMWPTTRAYTDFLVRTAATGDLADLAAALLPCAWGYVYIAEALARDEPPSDPRYAEWVTQYTSSEFREASDWLRSEMDRLAEGKTAEERERLTQAFVVSSRYELRFWDMCWEGETPRVS
jgi:thiaminase/transcriptional activator TenA